MTGSRMNADAAVISLTSHAPRRYFVDAGGRRVLIGLTVEETFEFERLDSEQVPDGAGSEVTTGDTAWRPDAGEQRRRELYEKHEGAWKAWMAQSRTEMRAEFNLY